MNTSSLFPTIVSFTPVITTENVTVRPQFFARFNLDMDYTQFNTDNLLNQLIFLVEENSAITTPVTFVSYNDKVLLFTPQSDLTANSTYQVTVRGEIQSADGRAMGTNRSFVFKVSSTSVGQPGLILPPNYTSVENPPLFTWTTVSSTGGTIQYRIQLDDSIEFNSVSREGWETVVPTANATPGIVLEDSRSYFWRVRAELSTITASASSVGAWSEPYCFYLGTFLQPSPATRETYPDAVTFQIDYESFDDGSSNLGGFPSMVYRFTTPIASGSVDGTTVYMTKEGVDGYPNSQKNGVNISTTVNGNTLTIVPGEGMATNMRYTLTINGIQDTSGNTLLKVVRYFTSRYSPLYLGANVLRANFGQYLTTYPDDLLNFHIFRVSLDINREYILYYSSMVGGPLEGTVRNMTFGLTYPMERWVEHESAVRILTMRFYELMEKADESKKLGDYSESHGSGILDSIQKEIATQRTMATKFISEFSRHRARTRNARKSERWPRWQDFNTDYSLGDTMKRSSKF